MGEDLVPADGEKTVLVPGDLAGGQVYLLGEVSGYPVKLLCAHLLGADAALVLKAVGVVVDPPGQTEPVQGRQRRAEQDQKAAAGGVPAASLGPADQYRGADDVDHNPHPGGYVQKLRQGDGY